MEVWLWIGLFFAFGIVLGILIAPWVMQHRDQQHLDRLTQTLKDSFSSLSVEALERNAERQRGSLEMTLKPMQETLKKAQEQIQTIERDRHTAYGNLSAQLKHVVTAQQQLSRETQSLTHALARPSVRGSYGELALKRVLELAGMTQHVDFVEQEQQASGRRPDVVVRLPDDRVLPIDAKAPLSHYLDAHNETDVKQQQILLGKFAGAVRSMVTDLAKKEYWTESAKGKSLDFVVMFVPGDQFLNAALEQDGDLMEYAMSRRVLLATPASLMAILRAVAYGWSQRNVAENAEQIRQLGSELYERIAGFAEHMGNLRKSLETDINHFNKMVGTLDRRVLPTTRKFRELGIEPSKDINEVETIDKTPREIPNIKDDS